MSALTGARVAIANRGEIAIRIAATCRRLGAVPVLLLGEPDRHGPAARQVGRVEMIGVAGSEFDVEAVIAAAKRAHAGYLHPGYGFLSERAEFAEACRVAGIVFIGPSPATLKLCGDKIATRDAAVSAGVPVLAASPLLDDNSVTWIKLASSVGFPLLVKPAGAGGGRGLRRVADENGLIEAVEASRRESASSGAGSVVYLERELSEPRHVEVQVAGDGHRTLTLGDRDCSVQRRHQKVIEEAPAPNIGDETRTRLHDFAERIGVATGLRGIATCEFLLGADGTIAFLEVNPRIQVEHPVTESVTGLDLVELQLLLASGEGLQITATPAPQGHAFEARIYAEDPWNGHFPVAGRLTAVRWPAGPGIRVDAGYATGDVVPAAYDPLLAKVIAHGPDRAAALGTLDAALLDTVVAGIPTNIPWLLNLARNEAVRAGRATTTTAAGVTPELPNHRPAVLGALVHLLANAQPAVLDSWSAIGPFRLAGPAPVLLHGDDWEVTAPIHRDPGGWSVTLDDETLPLRWSCEGSDLWRIETTGSVHRLAVVEQVGYFEVTGAGGRWRVRLGPKPAPSAARRRRVHDGRVRAPLPAKVLGVHANVGDVVAAGAPLVTLTAMKIEMVCEAPAAGTVESVTCAVGDQLESDQVMMTVKVDESLVE